MPQPFFDVNGDGYVTMLDVLIVINQLNSVGPGPVDDQTSEMAAQSLSNEASLAAVGDASSTMAVGPIARARRGEALSPGSLAWLTLGLDVTPVAISVAPSHVPLSVKPFAPAVDELLELPPDVEPVSGKASALTRWAIIADLGEVDEDRLSMLETLASRFKQRPLHHSSAWIA